MTNKDKKIFLSDLSDEFYQWEIFAHKKINFPK